MNHSKTKEIPEIPTIDQFSEIWDKPVMHLTKSIDRAILSNIGNRIGKGRVFWRPSKSSK